MRVQVTLACTETGDKTILLLKINVIIPKDWSLKVLSSPETCNPA